MSAWQKIETAPRDGTLILVWRKSNNELGYDHLRLSVDYFKHGAWWESRRDMPPTHWMPLPPPPEAP